MKRLVLIFMAMLTLCLSTLEISASVNRGSQITLRPSHPIGGATRPSKAPSTTLVPVEVAYDEFNDVLCFYDENADTVSFFIYDEEGVCVSQGACDFDENYSYSISLGLDAGAYTIVVFINDVEYYGFFDVEE